MQSVSVLLRVAFGLALGAAVVVAPGSYHDLARGLPSVAASHALADTSTCHRFSPDYRFDGDGPGVTNIGAISTQISVTLPSYICTDPAVNSGNEYFWNGIETGGTCTGLAQSGWSTEPDSNNQATPATYFIAAFNVTPDSSGKCNGTVFFENGVSGYPTFKTAVHSTDPINCQSTQTAEFYVDGTLYDNLCMDWGGGGGNQVVNTQEQFWQESRVPGVTYRNMTWCQSYGYSSYSACSPDLALYTSCTGYRGCITSGNLYNDWACFGQRQHQNGGYQGFDVWDQRSVNGGQYC